MTEESPKGWMKDPQHEKYFKPTLAVLAALGAAWALLAWLMR